MRSSPPLRPLLAALLPVLLVLSAGRFAGSVAAGGVDRDRANTSRLVYPGADGKLVYEKDARGNSVPDYSYAGYGGGGVPLPDAPVKVTLAPDTHATDDTPRIQAAIDQVARLPLDANGLRGAVLLQKGKYNCAGGLKIAASGIVLRGEGSGEDGTVLRATMHQKGHLIDITGAGERIERPGTRHLIADEVVPVGARRFHLDSVEGLKVGDPIIVLRNTNAKWVHEIGMDRLPPRPEGRPSTQWKPGPREGYERVITAIDGTELSVDVPLYNTISSEYGGGQVFAYSAEGRINNCGVENLRAESIWIKRGGFDYGDGRKVGQDDMLHADVFLNIDKAANAWVRDCACVDFLQGGVWMDREAKYITVQDCSYAVADPKLGYYVHEPHGETSRYAFCTRGQMTLTLRCTTNHARHSFMVHSQVPGPNVFVDCDATNQHAQSETHHRWATGVLYDCIGLRSPTGLIVVNRGWMGSGHGWSGAYCMLWNCNGNPITVENPPTASNWSVGCTGQQKKGPFNELQADAYESWGTHVEPMSLYRAQLRDRLGESALSALAAVAPSANRAEGEGDRAR